MDIFSIFIIAIGLAMDAFAVCITRGMCRQQFNAIRSAKVAMVFGFFQGLMPILGYFLGIAFKKWIEQFDHWLALIILSAIGLKMIYDAFQSPQKTSCNCRNKPDGIDWKKIILLAIATSIDALAAGIIFVPYGNLIFIAAVIIAVVCFLFSFWGKYIGAHLAKKFCVNIEFVGGLILIGIALKIFLQHTFSL